MKKNWHESDYIFKNKSVPSGVVLSDLSNGSEKSYSPKTDFLPEKMTKSLKIGFSGTFFRGTLSQR
jgi:hypothetical protein